MAVACEIEIETYISSLSSKTPEQRSAIIRNGSDPLEETGIKPGSRFMTAGYDDSQLHPLRRPTSPQSPTVPSAA